MESGDVARVFFLMLLTVLKSFIVGCQAINSKLVQEKAFSTYAELTKLAKNFYQGGAASAVKKVPP
jgi:hypothetical protein